MLNYGPWQAHKIIMINYEQETGTCAINDDLVWDFCNLRNPQKWPNIPSKSFSTFFSPITKQDGGVMLCHLAWADVHTYIMYKTNLQNPHEIHYVVECANC
jgi:hypothetical protein